MQQLETQLQIQEKQGEIEERRARTAGHYADAKKTLADMELGQDKLDTELQKEILDLLAARANKQDNGANNNGTSESGN